MNTMEENTSERLENASLNLANLFLWFLKIKQPFSESWFTRKGLYYIIVNLLASSIYVSLFYTVDSFSRVICSIISVESKN